MNNYIAVFFLFPMLMIPITTLWLCFKPKWLQSTHWLPSNRILLILYAAIAWVISILIIIMLYDWDHQTTIFEQLVAGLGFLVFSFGFISMFKDQLITKKWIIRKIMRACWIFKVLAKYKRKQEPSYFYNFAWAHFFSMGLRSGL